MLIGDGARLVTCARRHPCRAGHRAEGRAPDSASLCRSAGNDAARSERRRQAEPETGRAHIPGGLDETRRAVCAALLAGEADFDALCAAGGMESDELGALLIEMEMDGLVTPLAGTRYAPGPQMRD